MLSDFYVLATIVLIIVLSNTTFVLSVRSFNEYKMSLLANIFVKATSIQHILT